MHVNNLTRCLDLLLMNFNLHNLIFTYCFNINDINRYLLFTLEMQLQK